MQCPNCGYSMSVLKSDHSHGQGKTYDRVQYRCGKCDIWVLLETPADEDER